MPFQSKSSFRNNPIRPPPSLQQNFSISIKIIVASLTRPENVLLQKSSTAAAARVRSKIVGAYALSRLTPPIDDGNATAWESTTKSPNAATPGPNLNLRAHAWLTDGAPWASLQIRRSQRIHSIGSPPEHKETFPFHLTSHNNHKRHVPIHTQHLLFPQHGEKKHQYPGQLQVSTFSRVPFLR